MQPLFQFHWAGKGLLALKPLCYVMLLVWPYQVGADRSPPLTAAAVEKLVVAIPSSLPPYFINREGQAPQGFAIDVFEAVAENAGIEFRYQLEESPAAVRAALIGGRADIAPYIEVIKSHSPKIRFTEAAELVSASVFVRADSTYKTVGDDLAQTPLGLIKEQNSTWQQRSLKRLNPVSTSYYNEAVSGIYALLSGKIDSLVHTEPDVWHVVHTLKIADEIRELAPPLVQVPHAIALRSGDEELYRRLNTALQSVIESDRYQKIYQRWFGAAAFCSILCWLLWSLLALSIAWIVTKQWKRTRQLTMMNEVLQQQICDTTERLSEDNAYLQDLTITDTLTGINNRRGFEKRLNELILRAESYQILFSLMIFDIDDFKKVNDEYGHDIGDQVLIDLVKRVKNAVRDGDMLCRWGGEEFTILMPNTGRDGAFNIAERCRHVVADQPFAEIGYTTISVGVTSYLSGDEAGQIFKRADSALYRAKSEGKNRVIWHDRNA